MTLTAPTPLNENFAAFLDADIPFLLVFAMFFLVFAIGHATGYTHGHMNGVDRERRRLGSQLRHPTARRLRPYARFDADLTQTLHARPERLADAPISRSTVLQLADWERRFSEAFRAQLPATLATLNDRPHPMLLKHEKRLVCGQPAQTNLGTVLCLAQPGHPGQCA